MNINFNFYKNLLTEKKGLDSGIVQDFLNKELILRDYLALERTVLANEATFLAYIRTSLTMVVVGVTLIHLVNDTTSFLLGGLISIIGICIFIFGFIRTLHMQEKINIFLEKKNEIDKK